MTHLVMFDIDGTLVDSTGFDSRLYAQAIREVLGAGVDIDETWRSYRNVTDSGILEEILAQQHFDAPPAELRAAVNRCFVGLVRDYLDARAPVVLEIPGAVALVSSLRALPDVRLAVATGGWEETALMKLAAIGLHLDDIGFASSSDAPERTEIMRIAERRALGGAASRRRTYFGDGDWDKRASAELGYRFIAIGRAVEHEPRFDDYTNPDAVLACLAG